MSRLAIDARGLSKAYKIGKTRQQVLKYVDFTAQLGGPLKKRVRHAQV